MKQPDNMIKPHFYLKVKYFMTLRHSYAMGDEINFAALVVLGNTCGTFIWPRKRVNSPLAAIQPLPFPGVNASLGEARFDYPVVPCVDAHMLIFRIPTTIAGGR